MTKKINLKSITIVALFCCAVCQFFITQYFTIFQGETHLDIDSSWEFLKTIIGHQQGSVLPLQYMNITSQLEVEHLLLTVPLLGVTGNIWLSFAIENMVVSLLSITLIWFISKRLNHSFLSFLIIANLFICPFLANGFQYMNDLGYYSCVNVMSAHYNVAVLGILLLMLLFTFDSFDRRTSILTIVTGMLYAYLSMSKGFSVLVWYTIPTIAFLAIKVFKNNDMKILKSYKAIVTYILSLAVILGRLIGKNMGVTYADSRVTWIQVDDFFKNIGNVIAGYPLLLGGVADTDVSRNPLDFYGFVFLFGAVITAIFFIAIIFTIIKMIKEWEIFNDVLLFIIVYNLITIVIYSLLVLDEVKDSFDARYLIPSTILSFFLIGYFIEQIDNKMLFKWFGIAVLSLLIVCTDLYSDYFYSCADNGSELRNSISNVINKTDAKLVYFWDDERTLLDIERVLRVVDEERVYKCISRNNALESYGDYNYYDNSKEYDGPTVLVTKLENDYIDSTIMAKYKHLSDIGNVSVWYSGENPIDLQEL